MQKIYLISLFVSLANISFSQNVPVDFEPGGFGDSWTWTCFENDSNPPLQIIANPDATGLNTSATVAKFTALQAGNPWAGCETMHGSDIGTFNITSSNAIIRIMVWKTKISNVGIKLVTSTAASLGEILVPNTKINEWEQLTFDFSSHIGGMTYDQLVIFPDFVARPADDIIYFDNVFGEAAFLETEEIEKNQVSVFPNPSNGIFTLKSDQKIDRIEILNLEGKVLIESLELNQIDLRDFANGMYLLRTHQNGLPSTQKIQKK